LKGREWFVALRQGKPVAVWEYDGHDFRGKVPLPYLDWNTWHDEVVKKLRKECDVSFRSGTWDLQPWREAWHGPHWAREDPWVALTEYLEAK